MDWNKAYKGLAVHKPQFGFAIHGVPSDELDIGTPELHDAKAREWEQANEGRGIKISRITTLRRKPNTTAIHQSIVVFTEDANVADECIKRGFIINFGIHEAERYIPQLQITQCFNCWGYGHRAHQCKAKQKCGRCGKEGHEHQGCSTEACCAKCNKEHEAWHHNCTARTKEREKLAEIKKKTSPYYLA